MSDNDNIVHVPHSHKRHGIYHSIGDDCPQFPGDPRELTEDMAKSWGYEECQYCQHGGKIPGNATKDMSYQNALKEAAKND